MFTDCAVSVSSAPADSTSFAHVLMAANQLRIGVGQDDLQRENPAGNFVKILIKCVKAKTAGILSWLL